MFALYLCIAHFLFQANTYRFLHNSPYRYGGPGNSAMHKYAATTSEVPYHVLIVYNGLYCSGSLVRSKVVVTVASCFVRWKNHQIFVKVGSETVTGLGQVIEVLELKKHEYFNHRSNMDNDIALLMLKAHAIFAENVKKILMIEPEIALRDDTTVDVSGWGSVSLQPPKYSDRLLWSEMTVMNWDACKAIYPELMTRCNFCARYAPENRLNDNGGPAVLKNLLVGVLSFGGDNTDDPFVAVLTNVSYFHRWISLNTKRFLKKYCVPPPEYHNDYDIDQVHDAW